MTHRPLVGIVVSFAIGISANYFINIPFIPVFFTAVIFVIVNVILFMFYSYPNDACPARTLRRAKGRVLALLILIFLTGIAYHHLRFFSHADNDISNFIATSLQFQYLQEIYQVA